eukprot:GHUV01035951.1.p2 GENE.GHUV01035951.1~~GHUV01035951.1.p2  ORF type:complete len:113 (+),score=23.46 GHUV01035951.1:112-450(+)
MSALKAFAAGTLYPRQLKARAASRCCRASTICNANVGNAVCRSRRDLLSSSLFVPGIALATQVADLRPADAEEGATVLETVDQTAAATEAAAAEVASSSTSATSTSGRKQVG